ncbi:bacteriophage holin [Saccharopolyspora sp. CA-218241]|uniref:bacteriophage holin n=1 Tax=Saccharopolyspora sp. CA-218241 TaxID=3240027 RepID=UPI003D9552B8
MPYVLSLVLLVVGLVGLAWPVLRVFRGLRSFRSAQREVVGGVADRAGLLRARFAGLRVAFSDRWRG